MPGLSRSLAQRNGRYLQGGAGDRGPLVGRGRGMAENHVDQAEIDVELFGHHRGQRSARTRSEIDVAVEGLHTAFGKHGNEDVVVGLYVVGRDARLAWRRLGSLARRARYQQGAGAIE